MKIRPIYLLALVLVTLPGCMTVPAWLETEQAQPLYVPVNHQGDAKLPSDLQRVAILPIHGGEVATPESTAVLDTVLLTALQRQVRFETVVLSREDCQRMFGAGDFQSTAALPHGFMEKIVEAYAVDAVLFTDLTVYQAYRPLSLGLRSKLATVRDIRLVWAFDEVFSAGDATMVNSVRRYYREGDRPAPVDPAAAALQSPTRFGAVAADLMFRTLPAR